MIPYAIVVEYAHLTDGRPKKITKRTKAPT